MNKRFSKVISGLFNPLLMPLYMAIIIVYVHPQQFTDNSVIHNDVRLLYFAAIAVFFPAISIALMRKLIIVKTEQKDDPKHYFVPMIAIGTFWLWTYYMFKDGTPYLTSSYHVLSDMLLGCIISLFIIFPLNFTVKLNFHTIGVGALLSLLVNIVKTSQYNLVLIIVLAILLSGLVVSAQLSLKKIHKNTLLISFLIGYFGQFIAFQILSKFI